MVQAAKILALAFLVFLRSPGAGAGAVTRSEDLARRVLHRTYPSLFQAWTPAEKMNHVFSKTRTPVDGDSVAIIARHDLLWHGIGGFGVETPQGVLPGLAKSYTPSSLKKGLDFRAKLLKANPEIILLAEIRYFTGYDGYIPADSPWWLRDKSGKRIPDHSNGENPRNFYLLDFRQPSLQAQVVRLCQLAIDSGVVDGCFLDCWENDQDWAPVRVELAKKIRAAIGDRGLLVVNVNNRRPVEGSEKYINGLYMEGFNSRFFPATEWKKAASNMTWATMHLRKPVFTALEGWFSDLSLARNSYAVMRETTALSLIFSNGYVLFGDPNPLPTWDHLHDLYQPFWLDEEGKHALGTPREPPKTLAGVLPNGSYAREFERGTVVFNPLDNPAKSEVSVSFPEIRTSLGTGMRGKTFRVEPGDGDIYVR